MGLKDEATGKAKEFEGKLTGDKSREAEGKLDQAKGDIKDAAGKVKDAAGNLVDDVRDKDDDRTARGRAPPHAVTPAVGFAERRRRAPLRTLGEARHSSRAGLRIARPGDRFRQRCAAANWTPLSGALIVDGRRTHRRRLWPSTASGR